MNYVSLFSGIGGFDLALDRTGHHCVAQVEKDRACRTVLAKHWPGVLQFDDVMTFGRDSIGGTVDIVCGGSPCQSFSVAGLRKSLGDARGNLAFEFCRIVGEFQPQYVIWENVPGVLSTRDNAFGNFLAALVGEDTALIPAGGKWTHAGVVAGPERTAAWRVLDAQYFGVAQRRRRVFVVASAATAERSAAEILFESEGMRRHTPPRRAQGQEVVGSIGSRIARSHTELDGHGAYVYQHASGGGDDFKDTAQALRSGAEHSYQVVYQANGIDSQLNSTGEISGPIRAKHYFGGGAVSIYDARGNGSGDTANNLTGDHANRVTDYTPVVVQAARSIGTTDLTAIMHSATVRRLTPTECERLQAFPDGHTAGQADTPRYKQLGNAVCVNVVEWIARRLA